MNRWISPDPLEVHVGGSGDLNVYAYVSGQTLKSVDPLGLAPMDFERRSAAERSVHSQVPEQAATVVLKYVVVPSVCAFMGCGAANAPRKGETTVPQKPERAKILETAAFVSIGKAISLLGKAMQFVRGAKVTPHAGAARTVVTDVGAYGEQEGAKALSKSGVFEKGSLRSLQNPSGQGIDLYGRLTKEHGGGLVFFEFKTTGVGRIPALSKDQAKGAQTYVMDQLHAFARGKGTPAQQLEAKKLLGELRGQEVQGVVMKMDLNKGTASMEAWLPQSKPTPTPAPRPGAPAR